MVEGDVDVSSIAFSVIRFRKENNSTIPTCGFITAGDNSYDHFECSDKESSGWITLMEMVQTDGGFDLGTNVSKLSGDDLTDANWNMGPRNAQLNYKSGSDNFTFNVRVDRWGEEKRAYVSVELQEESSGLSFGNGEYFEIKVGDQPIGFDVRYASSSEAELGYWLMAEQKTVSDGDFQIDGVTVWSKSGNTITFDNGTSVWSPNNAIGNQC